MTVSIQLKRDTASNWTSSDRVLLAGELGIETDTNKFKIGDGTTAWTSLNYSSADLSTAVLLTGDQTIAGVKTFSSSPVVPTPTTDYQSATKKYVDDNSDAGELILDPTPDTNLTANGIKTTMTVDANATGVTATLHLDTDGNFIEADADADTTAPCLALALETGTGSKQVLLQGFVRNDAWNWVVGGTVYLSTTAGAMTQTAPSGTNDIVQVVGFATNADRMWFSPSQDLLTIE